MEFCSGVIVSVDKKSLLENFVFFSSKRGNLLKFLGGIKLNSVLFLLGNSVIVDFDNFES